VGANLIRDVITSAGILAISASMHLLVTATASVLTGSANSL
jgi:hypothetical protein